MTRAFPVPAVLLAMCLAGLGSAGAVRAGAWLRDEGTAFLSLGADLDDNGAVMTLFAERGITGRLTLGLDAWQSPFGDWSVLAVATVPILAGPGRDRVSASLGLGMARAAGREGPSARAGLHLGRGLAQGWLAADLTLTQRFADGIATAKATATWGRRFSDRCATILEVRGETRVPVSVAPSVLCRLDDRVQLRLGAARAVTGAGGPAVLGLQAWVEF